MKFGIEIDQQAINDAVLQVLVNETVEKVKDDLFEDGTYAYMRRMYKDTVQREVRELIKEHQEQIIEKAVHEAAEIIARKGIPKLIEKLG